MVTNKARCVSEFGMTPCEHQTCGGRVEQISRGSCVSTLIRTELAWESKMMLLHFLLSKLASRCIRYRLQHSTNGRVLETLRFLPRQKEANTVRWIDLGNLTNLRANVTLDGRCQQIVGTKKRYETTCFVLTSLTFVVPDVLLNSAKPASTLRCPRRG